MNKSYFCIFLILLSWKSFCFEYHIQKQSLNSSQLRVSLALSKELKTDQFLEVNRTPETLLQGLSVHQIFVSYIGLKTVAAVFLDNRKNINYPEKMNLGEATLYHFRMKHSVLAVWAQGLSEIEKTRIVSVLKNQMTAENENVWSHLLPQAYAQTCDARSEDPLNPVVNKLNESSYSRCWDKLGEGVNSYVKETVDDVKKKATLDYDLVAYWETVKNVTKNVANFAKEFFSNPVAWIQKNVPDSSNVDMSVFADIDKQQMLGLACLSIGHEGLSTLVSSVVRGPAGLGIKVIQMLGKISFIAKVFGLLKKFGDLTAEKFALMKDKIVKLAEKLIKGEHTPDKADSITGLMKMSPGLAQEGLACLGL